MEEGDLDACVFKRAQSDGVGGSADGGAHAADVRSNRDRKRDTRACFALGECHDDGHHDGEHRRGRRRVRHEHAHDCGDEHDAHDGQAGLPNKWFQQHRGERAIDLVLRSPVCHHKTAQEEDDHGVCQCTKELRVGGSFLGD